MSFPIKKLKLSTEKDLRRLKKLEKIPIERFNEMIHIQSQMKEIQSQIKEDMAFLKENMDILKDIVIKHFNVNHDQSVNN